MNVSTIIRKSCQLTDNFVFLVHRYALRCKNERVERRELGHRQFYGILCGAYFYVKELSPISTLHIVAVNTSRNLIA